MSDLVVNPKDRFSHDAAHLGLTVSPAEAAALCTKGDHLGSNAPPAMYFTASYVRKNRDATKRISIQFNFSYIENYDVERQKKKNIFCVSCKWLDLNFE